MLLDFVALTGYSLLILTIGILIGFRVAMSIEEKGRREIKRSREARD